MVPLSGSAVAQKQDTIVRSGTTEAAAAPQKSPAGAALYSLGATVLPMASRFVLWTVEERSGSWGRLEVETDLRQFGALLMVGDLVAGPAAGHFYADDPRHARTGRVAEDVLTGAIVLLMESAIVDIITAPFSAHHYNNITTTKRTSSAFRPISASRRTSTGLA